MGFSPWHKMTRGDYPNPNYGGGGVLDYPHSLYTQNTFIFYFYTHKTFFTSYFYTYNIIFMSHPFLYTFICLLFFLQGITTVFKSFSLKYLVGMESICTFALGEVG